jgi:hypothetical protein
MDCPNFGQAQCSDTRIINPIKHPDWNLVLESVPEHSFFHSSNWARVLNETYSYLPLYFTRWDGSQPRAVIPLMEINSFLTGKRGVSLPFTDLCEPIVADENCFSEILSEMIQYGRKAGWKYLELRGGAKYSNGAVPYRTYLRHILKIQGEEKLQYLAIKPSTRRNIRKAEGSGVRVAISDLESDLHTYYELHCLTRRRHGVPPQPYGFFKAIYKNVIAKGKGFTVLGTCLGRPISGAVYLHSGKKGIYKFGASDLQFQHLRAANLVMWEAIRWFSTNGFEELCFGRTDTENAGLVRFKDGWGARKEKIFYYRYGLNCSVLTQDSQRRGNLRNRVFKSFENSESRIFKALPVPFLRLAGSLLYRHMG